MPLKSATFTGVDLAGVRPGSRPRMGEQLEAVAKDQMRAYESTVDIAGPGSGQVKSGHLHDGVSGNPIPIPLAQSVVHGTFGATPDPFDNAGYYTYHYLLFFAPPGVTTVRAYMFCGVVDVERREHFKVSSYSSSFALIDESVVTNSRIESGLGVLYQDLAVNAGTLNVVRFWCWEGETFAGVAINPPRNVLSVSVCPWIGVPRNVPTWVNVTATDTEVNRPVSTQHDGSSFFVPIEASMVADDEAISSYLLAALAMNDAFLWEKITNTPAIGYNTRIVEGHNHDGDTSNLDASAGFGALVGANLASWGYGARRFSGDVDHPLQDQMNDTEGLAWTGNVGARGADTAPPNPFTQGVHMLRAPHINNAADVQGGTSKLFFAALLFLDAAPQMTVDATIGDDDHSSTGTTTTLTFGTTGFEIQSGQIDFYGAGAPTVGEDITLKVEMDQSGNNKNGGSLLATCLYLDPT